MRAFKILSIMAVAALLMTPMTAMARSSFSFSFNVFDCLPFFAPPPPVIVEAPPPPVYYMPCPPPCPPQRQTIVTEYHHYYYPYQSECEQIRPKIPHQHGCRCY